MTDKKPLGGVVCHYCHNPGHIRWDCRKLQNRDQRFQYAHKSLKSASTPSTMLFESSKPNTCLISSSAKCVIHVSVVSPTRFRYFVTFVDDYSQTTWLYLMKNRLELFSHFRAFCAKIHTQFHVYVQNLRSDNAK